MAVKVPHADSIVAAALKHRSSRQGNVWSPCIVGVPSGQHNGCQHYSDKSETRSCPTQWPQMWFAKGGFLVTKSGFPQTGEDLPQSPGCLPGMIEGGLSIGAVVFFGGNEIDVAVEAELPLLAQLLGRSRQSFQFAP